MKLIIVKNSVVLEIVPDTDENYSEKKYLQATEIEDDVEVSLGDFWDPHADPEFRPMTKKEILTWSLKSGRVGYGKFEASLSADQYLALSTNTDLTNTITVDKKFGVFYENTAYVDAGIVTEDEWDTLFDFEPLPVVVSE